MADPVGAILAGKYQLIDLLGRGGMGSVWRARHLALDSMVAVKLVDPTIASHPEALGRFLREAQAAAALRSPHVVQILDYGAQDHVPFIVMELMEGETLANRLARFGRLAPEATAEIMVQVCRAVGRAHEQGIIHRDLKPENIFLTANDDVEVAKVLDFGVAKRSDLGRGQGMTQTGAVLGTPYYMSPEQAEGSKLVDYRSDLWSLAVIVFECMTGRRPFEAETLGGLVLAICTRPIVVPSQVASVPVGFDEWFARGTARDMAQRFGSAKELAASLRSCCLGRGSSAELRSGDLPTGSAAVAVGDGLAMTPQPQALNKLGLTSAASAMSRSTGADEMGVPLQKNRALPVMVALGVAILLGSGGWWFLQRSGSPDSSAIAGQSDALGPSTKTASQVPSTSPLASADPTREPVLSLVPVPGQSASAAPAVSPSASTQAPPVTAGARRPRNEPVRPPAAAKPVVARPAATTKPAPAKPKPAGAAINLGI